MEACIFLKDASGRGGIHTIPYDGTSFCDLALGVAGLGSCGASG